MTETVISDPATIEAGFEKFKPVVEHKIGSLFIVEAQWFHGISLLHTLTAKHLLTFSPETGDRIAARLTYLVNPEDDGRVTVEVDRKYARYYIDTENNIGRKGQFLADVTSHAGRSPMLGEDGLEDAYGRAILADVVFEKIIQSAAYQFVPIQFEERPYEGAKDRKGRDEIATYRPAVTIHYDSGQRSRAYDSAAEAIQAEGVTGIVHSANWSAEDYQNAPLTASRNIETAKGRAFFAWMCVRDEKPNLEQETD